MSGLKGPRVGFSRDVVRKCNLVVLVTPRAERDACWRFWALGSRLRQMIVVTAGERMREARMEVPSEPVVPVMAIVGADVDVDGVGVGVLWEYLAMRSFMRLRRSFGMVVLVMAVASKLIVG